MMGARAELYRIRALLITGQITYDEAKVQAQPFIDHINIKGEEIAKKYGKRFTKTTFSQQMR